MLIDELNVETKRMNVLKRNRQSDQEKITQRTNYSTLSTAVSEVYLNMQKLKKAHELFGMCIEDELQSSITETIDALDAIIATDDLNSDNLQTVCRSVGKKVTKPLSDAWSAQYRKTTSSVKGSLSTVEGLIEDKTALADINASIFKAADWSMLSAVDSKQQDRMTGLKNSIDCANGLLNNLNLDPKISAFLAKVTKGTASIGDLNDEIMEWIKDRHLTDKFSIGFSSK